MNMRHPLVLAVVAAQRQRELLQGSELWHAAKAGESANQKNKAWCWPELKGIAAGFPSALAQVLASNARWIELTRLARRSATSNA